MADGQALLAVLDSHADPKKLRAALDELHVFLQPLLGLGREEEISVLRPIARTVGPLVTSLVKSMGARLCPKSSCTPEQLKVLGEAACLALNALDCLRPVIKASRHELEVQRYNFVRKMAALGLYGHAMAQGKVLHASAASGPGTVAGAGELHIAAVANLLICYSELVQTNSKLAEGLWGDILGPIEGLLALTREAADVEEASKRLEPVLKCLSKVAETLHHAEVISGLSHRSIAQQLSALVQCSEICRQGEPVRQMLLEDAMSADEAVQICLVEGLLHQLTISGSLPGALRSVLHQVTQSLVQRKTVFVTSPASRPCSQHPLGVLVRTALQMPSCLSPQLHADRLGTVLSALGSAAVELSIRHPNDCDGNDPWLAWCCLDVLRLSTSTVFVQLISTPQSAGGNLPILARLMEMLGTYSLHHAASEGVSCALPVVPSGCSAITMAVRLQAAHCMHTGQLARLADDTGRALELLGRLLDQSGHGSGNDNGGELSPLLLQSLSASLSNSGLDLLQAQHVEPAAQLLQAAADLAIKRALQLVAQGAPGSETELSQVVKKCKAHVTALQQLSKHTRAMATTAQYVARLHSLIGDGVHIVAPLIKLYVRSSIAATDADAAMPVSTAAQAQAPAAPAKPTFSAAPAAPCKAQRRGGRLKRVADNEDEAQQPAQRGTAESHNSSVWQPAGPTKAPPAALVRCLTTAAAPGCGAPGLLDALDMYAVQELEVVAEEAKRQPEPDAFQQNYTGAVLGPLLSSADMLPSRPVLKARALLVRALASDTDLPSRLSDLRTGCNMLDAMPAIKARASCRDVNGADADPGLFDSAALAYAQLGVYLAQDQLSKHACTGATEAIGYVVRALVLWDELLNVHRGRGTRLMLRMPQATLHAVLQVQQLLHLYADTLTEVPGHYGQILGQLVGAVGSQVKLREQHAYLLCTSTPGATCVVWALAPRPCLLLADAVPDVQHHSKLADVLKVLDPVRRIHDKDATEHSLLASAADVCTRELEGSAFLRHGLAPLLLRSQCHQVAAAAYLRAGNTAEAYVHAQEALRVTCSLFALLECQAQPRSQGGAQCSAATVRTSSADIDLTPAEAAAAAVTSGVEVSAVDYAVEEEGDGQEEFSAGNRLQAQGAAPTDASALLDPKCRSNVGVGLAWAIAASHMVSLHQTARVFEAAGCAEDAMCLWKECSRAAELFNVTGVRVLCSSHLAELSCRRGDMDAAKAHLQAAGVAVGQAEAACMGMTKSVHVVLLSAHMRAAQSRLALAQQQDSQAVQVSAGAIELCDAYLRTFGACRDQQSCSGICTDQPTGTGDALRWDVVCLRSQLERLRAEALLRLGRTPEAVETLHHAEVQLQQAAAACSSRSVSAVWPIDHGLLLAHRSSAATTSNSPACGGTGARIVGLGCGQVALLARGIDTRDNSISMSDETSDEACRADQSSKKGAKAKGGGAHTKIPGNQQRTEGRNAVPDAPVSRPHIDVAPLLVSLQMCWQVPLAAGYACRQLMRACMDLGLPHAASMFLHLSQGASYAQQQELQGRLVHRTFRRSSQSSHLSRCMDSVESEDSVIRLSGGVREAAFQMLSDIAKTGGSHDVLTAALEQGAAGWLRQALELLPTGAVVSSILLDSEVGQLLLSRLAVGSVPLLVSLGGSLSPGAPGSGATASGVLDGCLARLHRLLDESGDSMRIDQDAATSQSQKANWWKTRTALDNGISELLRDLDAEYLGPWRCLLLPKPNSHQQELQSAVDAFIAEHFSEVNQANGDAPNSRAILVLRELLCVAMVHIQHLQGPDLSTLLQAICSHLSPPVAPAYASALAMKFTAAEAAARIQLVRLQPSCTAVNSECMDTQSNNSSLRAGAPTQGAASSGGRNAGAAAIKDSRAASTGAGAGVQSSRARPGAGRMQAGAGKTSSNVAAWRAGAAACVGIGMVMDDDDEAAAPKPAAAASSSGRGSRAPRLAALQPEAASFTERSKGTSRPIAARAGQRSRTTAAAAQIALDAEEAPQTSASASVECNPGRARRTGLQDRGPVLLVLGPTLHALPWESIPCFRGQEYYRILSLLVACATASRAASAGASYGFLDEADSPSSGVIDGNDSASHAESLSKSGSVATGKLSAYYVLNPTGDLEDTQRFFQPILEAEPNWRGLTGIRPDTRALITALQSHDIFLYFGHGSGEQFLPLPALRKLKRCAACLLMGCSSGRLRLHGVYDPTGAAVSYLLSGCPALVANLWDVTDRDIDRYCHALMQSWLGCFGAPSLADTHGGGAKGSSGGNVVARAHQPSTEGEGVHRQLGVAAARSRDACKLMHLTGAAPVCYGLPLGRQ